MASRVEILRRLAVLEEALKPGPSVWDWVSPFASVLTDDEHLLLCRVAHTVRGEDGQHPERWAGHLDSTADREALWSILSRIDEDRLVQFANDMRL